MKKKTVRDNGKILSGICFALIIGFWCIATYGGLISDLFLPSPTEVSKENHRDGERRFAVGKLLGIHSQSFSRLDLVCDRSTSGRYAIRYPV